ncbi:MAG: hypothetical protein PHE55_13365 [Methylococcaceae bacterium]|nr:hypothetical protein [Methylococcaceae bacterium]
MDSQLIATSILVLADGPADEQAIVDDDVELAFGFDPRLELHPNASVNPEDISTHLAYSVSAFPYKLLRHTQRILFCYENRDGEGLYGALLDLFLVLNGRGVRLRKRLLSGARERLSADHYNALAYCLMQGVPAREQELPATRKSVLTRGILGIEQLVQVYDNSKASVRDPLIEAREYIEYFQLEEARELLEDAIIDQPNREDLHFELLQLYKATRDASHFEATREKLRNLMPDLPEYWQNFDGLPLGGKR